MASFSELTFFDNPIQHFPQIESTNNYLKELKNDKPLLVLADYQTKGRGQYKKTWMSKSGDNLLFSFQFFPKNLLIDNSFIISQIIALSIVSVINPLLSQDRAYIKWPNDIILKNKKICGILIEPIIQGNQIQRVIVGIGLNVNQLAFDNELTNASSLGLLFPALDWDRMELLKNIIIELELRLQHLNKLTIEREYHNTLYKLNDKINLIYKGKKMTVYQKGVDMNGYWVLEDSISKIKYVIKSSSEVEFLYL